MTLFEKAFACKGIRRSLGPERATLGRLISRFVRAPTFAGRRPARCALLDSGPSNTDQAGLEPGIGDGPPALIPQRGEDNTG